MQHVPAFDLQPIATEGLIAGDTPDICRHIALGEHLLRLEYLIHDRPTPEQLGAPRCASQFRWLILVHTFEDALSDFPIPRHRGHHIILVAHRQIVKHIFLGFIHAMDAVLHDDGQFIGEGRIVREQGGDGIGQ